MNESQQNKLSVLKELTGLFHQLEVVWKEITPVVLTFEELSSITATIENTQYYDEHRVSEGVTLKDSLERFNVINQAYTIVLKLHAFAKATGNKQLMKQSDISFSELKASSEAMLIKTGTAILNNAKKYKNSGLVISDDTIIDYDLALEIYKLVCIKTNPTFEEQAALENNLENMFAEADRLLDSLDKSVGEHIDDKSFISRYKKARKPLAKRKTEKV